MSSITIKDLRALPCNTRCFDCSVGVSTYANMTVNTFVCQACAGVLRDLNHRVKSIGMTSFTKEELGALESGGNEVARRVWRRNNLREAEPPGDASAASMKRHMEFTYVAKKWFNPQAQRANDNDDDDSSSDEPESLSDDGEAPMAAYAARARKISAASESDDESSTDEPESLSDDDEPRKAPFANSPLVRVTPAAAARSESDDESSSDEPESLSDDADEAPFAARPRRNPAPASASPPKQDLLGDLISLSASSVAPLSPTCGANPATEGMMLVGKASENDNSSAPLIVL
jgi:hypothetical protein